MVGANTIEKPLAGFTQEQWDEEVATAQKMAASHAPTESHMLRLRAVQTIGQRTGREANLEGAHRFLPLTEEEIRTALDEPFLTVPMRILLYEALIALS